MITVLEISSTSKLFFSAKRAVNYIVTVMFRDGKSFIYVNSPLLICIG